MPTLRLLWRLHVNENQRRRDRNASYITLHVVPSRDDLHYPQHGHVPPEAGLALVTFPALLLEDDDLEKERESAREREAGREEVGWVGGR